LSGALDVRSAPRWPHSSRYLRQPSQPDKTPIRRRSDDGFL
jgi:hypothetical protein